jgi:hypothetical protein
VSGLFAPSSFNDTLPHPRSSLPLMRAPPVPAHSGHLLTCTRLPRVHVSRHAFQPSGVAAISITGDATMLYSVTPGRGKTKKTVGDLEAHRSYYNKKCTGNTAYHHWVLCTVCHSRRNENPSTPVRQQRRQEQSTLSETAARKEKKRSKWSSKFFEHLAADF